MAFAEHTVEVSWPSYVLYSAVSRRVIRPGAAVVVMSASLVIEKLRLKNVSRICESIDMFVNECS